MYTLQKEMLTSPKPLPVPSQLDESTQGGSKNTKNASTTPCWKESCGSERGTACPLIKHSLNKNA